MVGVVTSGNVVGVVTRTVVPGVASPDTTAPPETGGPAVGAAAEKQYLHEKKKLRLVWAAR